MALARWQATIQDEEGNVLPGASVEVRQEITGSPLVTLFSDRDGLVPIGNPVDADGDGFVAFHVVGGAYRITATLSGFSRTWRYVGIGTLQEQDASNVDITGGSISGISITSFDIPDSVEPASPDGNAIRLYAFDGGDSPSASRLGIKDSSGNVTSIGSGLFLPVNAPISWGTDDVRIEHSSNALDFVGATSGYGFDHDVNQSRVGGQWTDEPALKAFTVTVTIASPAVMTWTNHGRQAGDRFRLTTTGALPTGLAINTTYFVLATGLTANTFQLSATDGGAPITTTGSQSGVHSAHIVGVNIARFERVLISDAVANDGTLVGSQGDVWLDAYDGLITTASDLAVVSRNGLSAGVFAVRTSDRQTGPSNGIAASFYAINDNLTSLQVAFGIYIEAFRPSGAGTIHCLEMDATEFGTSDLVRPYTTDYSAVSAGLWVASGGGNETGTTDASVALHILNNNSKWRTGIAFDAEGLTDCDGVTGIGEAIALAKGHALNWYFAGNNLGFRLYSDVAASADAQSMLVNTDGTFFLNNSLIGNFRVGKVAGTVTGSLAVVGSTSADPALISEGSAANIPLTLTPKGTGSIRLDGQTITTGALVSTGDATLSLGGERSGSGNAILNLHTTSGSAFESRWLRQSGANGNMVFSNSGTGSIQFDAANASGILQFLINSVDKFRVDNSGPISQVGLATPAAASALPLIRGGSAGVGLYMGTGSPNGALTAPKGSLYVQTDATTTTSRLWVNTNAGTTWANFTSSA